MSLPRLKHIESQDPKFPLMRRRSLNQLLIAGVISVFSIFLIQGLAFIAAIVAVGYVIIETQYRLWHRNQIENFLHYRALEALSSLHAVLNIRHPLPPMRLWVISPDLATLLVSVIQQYKPKTIVELGSGTSTIIGSYCVEKRGEGKIMSYEHIEKFTDETRRGLRQHELEQYAEVIFAPLTETLIDGVAYQWYDTLKMEQLEKIDLLVVDGPPDGTNKMARFPAVPVLYDKLSDGAIILVDDYMREDEHAMVNQWLEKYELEVIDTFANEKGAAILRKKPRPVISGQQEAE